MLISGACSATNELMVHGNSDQFIKLLYVQDGETVAVLQLTGWCGCESNCGLRYWCWVE